MKRGVSRAALALAVGSLAFSAVGTTAADPAPPGGVRFTAAGDYGQSLATTGRVLDGIAALAPDAHVALGDLSYSSTMPEEDWCDFVTARVGAGRPFQLVAGNHEDDGPDGQVNNFSACLPNQLPGAVGTYGRQYHVDVPAQAPLVRLVMISPGLTFPGQAAWTYAHGTAQYAWTAAAIDGARRAGIPWVVVGSHKPCLSLGNYSCDIGRDLLDLLLDRRVDLVLAGHEHNYQRTHQLGVGGTCARLPIDTTDERCIVDTDRDLTKGAGTVFMTVGTGGTNLRVVNLTDPEAGYFGAWSGSNVSPAHGVARFDVTAARMAVDFAAATGTFADPFTLTRDDGPNTPPTASFTTTTSGSDLAVDGSGSSDGDGTVVLHEWDFGDGSWKTGATARHSYRAAGDYEVTLTVMDNRGATDRLTSTVSVAAPETSGAVIRDAFGRVVAEGWGQADSGGTWRVDLPGRASVDGAGVLVALSAGDGPLVDLEGTLLRDLGMRYSLQLDKVPSGKGGRLLHTTFLRRGGGKDYRAVLRFESNGGVNVELVRRVAGVSTRLGSQVPVPGLGYTAGTTLLVRLEVRTTGSSTDLRVKVWEQGSAEPAGWTIQRTDDAAELQVSGGIAFRSLLSSATLNAPVTARHDDLEVVQAAP